MKKNVCIVLLFVFIFNAYANHKEIWDQMDEIEKIYMCMGIIEGAKSGSMVVGKYLFEQDFSMNNTELTKLKTVGNQNIEKVFDYFSSIDPRRLVALINAAYLEEENKDNPISVVAVKALYFDLLKKL